MFIVILVQEKETSTIQSGSSSQLIERVLPPSLWAFHKAECRQEKESEGVFNSDKETILGIKFMGIASVEQVFVIEESPLLDYFSVSGVDLGNYHIHENGSQDNREPGKREVGKPVMVHLLKHHTSYSRLNEGLGALVDSRAPVVLLEKDCEIVSSEHNEQRGEEHPNEKSSCIKLNNFGKRTE